jgi:hypothetical protein
VGGRPAGFCANNKRGRKMSNRATAREIFFMATSATIAADHTSGLDEGGPILGE